MTTEGILTCDKTNWFVEKKGGIRIWKQELVANFWQLVKVHKILRGDYNFENIVFPSCVMGDTESLSPSSNYFVHIFSAGSKLISSSVHFKNCRFQDNAQFLGHIPGIVDFPKADITFTNGLIFEDCIFEGEFRIQGQKIHNSFIVKNSQFYGKSVIMMSSFFGTTNIASNNIQDEFSCHHNKHFGNANFSSNKFEKNYKQTGNVFYASFTINTAEFNGNLISHSNEYQTYGSLVNLKINSRSSFRAEVYNNFQFQDVDFSSNNHLIENIKFTDVSIMTIRNVIFHKSVTLRNCDFTRIKLLNSEISEIKFSACSWGDSDRIVLLNENDLKKHDKEAIKELEYLYRELKRNFENSKDWELTGRSYVSELKFRQQRLLIEKKYFSWFVYWFYDIFGGFTESYVRPTFWFVSLTFLIFPQYYRLFEDNTSHYSEFYIKSLAASAPWLQTELEYQSWFIVAFQKTLSAILLTFIILALRKRFR